MAYVRLFGVEQKEKPKRRKLPIVFGLIFLLVLVLGTAFFRMAPRMEKIVASAARSAASAQIDEVILNYMETNGLTYGNIVDIHYDGNGAISSVTADTAKIDILIARMDDEIGKDLEEVLMETEIPLNVLLGTELLLGGGPKIRVHFFPINIVNIETRHEFVSQGINQTLHTVFLNISVDIEILFPMKSRVESVDTEIPIGQTLIVGGVPTTYVER